MKNIRTDLAFDDCEKILCNKNADDGIECTKEEKNGIEIVKVRITNENGERLTGKKMGEYITIFAGKLWLDERGIFKTKVFEFSKIIREMLLPQISEHGTLLFAGLGNEFITADSIGPESIKNIIVTRHIKNSTPMAFEEMGLFDTCAIIPGVLGQTGIESADIIKSVVEKIKPSVLVVIDALASRKLERLVTTIQISNSGINPGSGVGNSRPEINEKTMGVPVISIGVPTVVDAATLAYDAIENETGKECDYEEIKKSLSDNDLNFFVTPKETDTIIKFVASFIGYSLNIALNPLLSYEDMLSLLGG